MENNFSKILSSYQIEIEEELKKFFDTEIKGAKTPFLVATLKTLQEYSLRPGKKIRAILINYGYFLAGGRNKKEILRTSIFIELIHNFLLIHDDILDKEKMRRGKKTLHRLYQESSKFKKDYAHYGTGMAIIGGDMMEFLGRKILDQSKFSSDRKQKAVKKLNQILELTAYGEIFEFWLKDKFQNGEKINEKDILDVYKNKTAFYTFVGPLQIGGELAGGSKKLLNSFEKIGTPLGIAFQLKDDMQDFLKDIKEAQPNLLIVKTINNKGKKITGIHKITSNSIKNSESLNECQQMAENLITQVKIDIAKLKYPKKESEFLINLADYILNRND